MATTKRFVARFGIDNNGNSITNLGAEGSELSLDSGHSVSFTTTGPTALTLPTSGTLATTDQLGGGGGGPGTLTLQTDGIGLSGSQTFSTAADATFTVTSNATDANTPDTIVARDGSGNFSAGTASLTGLSVDGELLLGSTSSTAGYKLKIADTTPAIRLEETSAGQKRLDIGVAASGVATISAPQSTQSLVLSTVGATRLVAAPTGISYLGSSSTGTIVANGSAVTSVIKTAAGANFTSFPTVSISAPTGAGGVQATATVSGMTFHGTSPTINNGGTGYAVNDVLTVVGTSGALTLTVTAVSGGVITAASHTAFGTVTSLPSAPYSVTGGSGTGATFTSTWQIVSIAVGVAGSGYLETPTVTISGGGGSGATATAYIGSMPTLTTAHSSLALQTPGGNLSVRLMDDTVASTGVTPTTLYIVSSSTAAGRAAIRSSKALYLSSATTNGIYFTTQSSTTTDGTTQFTVTNTTGAVNFCSVTGATANNGPVISFTGNDANVGGFITTKGTSGLSVSSGAGTYRQFRIDGTTNAVNYLQVSGATTNNPPVLSAQGSDSTIALLYQAKGGQDHRFFSNGGNAEQFRVIHTAGTIANYPTVTGAVSGASPSISVQGSDSSINFSLSAKGTGAVQSSSPFRAGTSGANYHQFVGATTGQSPTYSVQGSDASIDLSIAAKGAGSVKILTADAVQQVAISHTASAVNYLQLTGAASTVSPQISSQGTDANIGLILQAKAASIVFLTRSTNARSFNILDSASPVNYLQVQGNTTGTAPILSAQGSDANISISIQPKGTGTVAVTGATATSTDAELQLTRTSSSTGAGQGPGIRFNDGTTNNTRMVQNGSGNLQFWRYSGSWLTDMTLNSSGNLGVGTTTPVNKLDVNGSFGRGAPVTKTADFTLAANENWIICDKAGSALTVTLPAASSWAGREIMLKNVQTSYGVQSASANVIPFAGGSAATSILSAGVADATLVSNGTAWVISQTSGASTLPSTIVSRGTPVIKTGTGIYDSGTGTYSPFTISSTENCIIFDGVGGNPQCELPSAAAWPGRELLIKNVSASFAVISKQLVSGSYVDTNNVIQCDSLTLPASGPYIIAGTRKWVTLVSDGSAWVVMTQGSTV
jgi:hypothetical protein